MVVQNQSQLGKDEAVHKELGDSLLRAATTASSLKQSRIVVGGSGAKKKPLGDYYVNWFLDLEQTKTTQHNEIASLKRRVKKLEKKNRSRTHRLKRLHKVGLTARVESSDNEESLGEDASKQGRIDAIDADEEIALVSVHDVNVSAGKGILIEPVKPMNKKDLIRLDEETTLNLQAGFDEEERLAREKAEKEEEANIALIETWDDIQAKIDADHQLAERMQAQEQEELSIKRKGYIISTTLREKKKAFCS
ncbi:hypothetical protein Tco_0608930 [Tanacetum coccineum]